MPKIDGARLLGDLRQLASFGAYKTGVHRPSLSPEDMAARRFVMGRFEAAGLTPQIDGIASVFGWSKATGPRLLTGSHLESQNYAGWLDGALGVIYGLEAARAFAGDAATRHIAIDIAAWFDEEGHFGSFPGSRSGIGILNESDIAAMHNRYDGSALTTKLAEWGLAGTPRVVIDGKRYLGYCEAHIEQGDVLESRGLNLGIVTAIVGNWQYRLTFAGVQNHAGTTRMAIRRDAGVALTDLCHAIKEHFPALAGPLTVWTTGRISLDPGAPSIIPGGAEMLFQIRDADASILKRLDEELRRLIGVANERGPCTITLEVLSQSTPALMNEGLQSAFERAAEALAPGKHLRLPSGAGHDAQYLARIMPSSMLFIPSIGGISHHWSENTKDEDIILGCEVYVEALARMAGLAAM